MKKKEDKTREDFISDPVEFRWELKRHLKGYICIIWISWRYFLGVHNFLFSLFFLLCVFHSSSFFLMTQKWFRDELRPLNKIAIRNPSHTSSWNFEHIAWRLFFAIVWTKKSLSMWKFPIIFFISFFFLSFFFFSLA